MEICPRCGLPEPACICEQMQKSLQRIRVAIDKKRYGKVVTLISGFDNSIDVKKIVKQMKNQLACGGTIHENRVIELQGDHTKRAKQLLIKMGFDEESIE